MPTGAARLMIEVVAGILPGEPIPEHTRRFGLTSGEYEDPDREKASMAWHRVHGEAVMYMLALMNPPAVNWVRLDWIWL